MLRRVAAGFGAVVCAVSAGVYYRNKTRPASMVGLERRAVCVLKGDNNIQGVVTFYQRDLKEPTHIEARVSGLTPGKHGFHIHEFGDLTNGCTTAGDHYNPFVKKHGGPTDEERHVGDLGNIEANTKGEAVLVVDDPIIKLSGPYSVIGRAMVVHANPDDLGKGGFPDSETTGHSGPRVACGVIGIAKVQ